MSPVRTIITIILMFLFLIGTVSHSQTECNALAVLNLRPTIMEAML
ncbi:MAG: hypothetical protein JRF71_05455 [Deltaproteobacteria bacterium]|nr:hypothetical protein [Deltaproteobacteria bacterium]MBW2200266.1 hypothetical protein [Deltaproteobacteria bacterium]